MTADFFHSRQKWGLYPTVMFAKDAKGKLRKFELDSIGEWDHHTKENSLQIIKQATAYGIKYMRENYGIEINQVVLYTDNCGGENKNRWMLDELTVLAKKSKVDIQLIMNESYHNK